MPIPDLQPVKLADVGSVEVIQNESEEVWLPPATVAFKLAEVFVTEVAGSVLTVAGFTALVVKLTQEPIVAVPGFASDTNGASATIR